LLTLVADGRSWPLAKFAKQTAQRVSQTGILVTQAQDEGVEVSVVDFAPLDPDLDALVRFVLVTNSGREVLRNTAVRLDLRGRSEGRAIRRTLAAVDEDRLLVYGRANLSVKEHGGGSEASFSEQRVSVIQPLGSLSPGQRRLAIFVMAPLASADHEPATSRTLRPNLSDPMRCLQRTAEAWRAWYDEAPLRCSDERLSDLTDSLLELVRSHIGAQAIHTGSLRYNHGNVYLRDTYWVQRALFEAGRPREAQASLGFFWHMWQQNGLASYYSLPDRVGHGYGYQRVELPHYLVLMVRDAERWAGVDPKPYWPMVKACLESAAADDGYQVMNGDETWLLAVPVHELAWQLDNTWLLQASARYAADLARRMGDAAAAQRFAGIAAAADRAAEAFVAQRACQRGANYWDRLPISGVIARGAMLEPERVSPRGGEEARGRAIASWLESAWRDLRFNAGVRSSARSTVFDGGTPGYVLYAAAHLRLPFAADLVRGIEDLSAPMGNVWELHDAEDPAWGTEKRRLWDSAVVLAGLAHYLYGITPTADGVIVDPNPPAGGSVQCARFPLRGHRLGLRATPTSLRLTWDGKVVLDADQPVGAVIRGGRVVETFPRAGRAEPAASPSGWPAQISGFLGSATPRFAILHEDALNHARRIAVEMVQHKQFVPVVATLDRARLDSGSYGSAIIIARSIPPVADRPYAVESRGSVTHVWVKNTGDVWADTDPLLHDLVRFSPPQRPRPLPFPDAALDLSRRLAVFPAESVRVRISTSAPMQLACGADTAAAATSLECRSSLKEMQARLEDMVSPFVLVGSTVQGNVADLVVIAESPQPASVKVVVTLPPTCWVVSSRGNAGWDRDADPVREYRDPDGSRRLVFALNPGRGPARRAVSLKVAQLPVGKP